VESDLKDLMFSGEIGKEKGRKSGARDRRRRWLHPVCAGTMAVLVHEGTCIGAHAFLRWPRAGVFGIQNQPCTTYKSRTRRRPIRPVSQADRLLRCHELTGVRAGMVAQYWKPSAFAGYTNSRVVDHEGVAAMGAGRACHDEDGKRRMKRIRCEKIRGMANEDCGLHPY
jgi:hypothetical protein